MTKASVTSQAFRVAQLLSIIIIPLTLLVAAGGLLIPGLYGSSVMVPATRGQDLLTLITLPVLALALAAARRGSTKAAIVWAGILGYSFYTYTGAAFAYGFNRFFLVYVALFSLSVAALIALATGLDLAALKRSFTATTPRGPVVGFLIFIAVMLVVPELGQIIPALANGTVPDLIARSNGAGNFIYVLDLGVITPLTLLAAAWLWRRLSWGYLLAGFMMIKAVTMGLALLSMTWFSLAAGQPLELGLTIIYAAIAVFGLVFSVWFLRHCRA